MGLVATHLPSWDRLDHWPSNLELAQSQLFDEEMMSGDYENLIEVFGRDFGDYVDLIR